MPAAKSVRATLAGEAQVLASHLPNWKVLCVVSTTESYSNAREALDDLQRAEASPYVDYPPTPRWYPPLVGLWAGALVMAIDMLIRTTWIGCLAIAGLVVVQATFLS